MRKSSKVKARGASNEEPAVRKLTRLVPIDEGAVLAIEEEAEHDKAECSDEERIRQEEEKGEEEGEDSVAETELVPPSIDEDEDIGEGYKPEKPMTADEYTDALLRAADASKLFKETFFPALKQRIVTVRKYKLPWYDEPACINERFCVDNSCDTSNRYPAWAWCLLRCAMKSNAEITGRVVITFEPVSRRVYVMVDEHRFGKPIQLLHPDMAQKSEVDRVVFEVRKKLEQVAAASRGLMDIEDE